jgi:hypothetical protein
MAEKPHKEFGKRRAVATPPAPPVKRSNHVALLLMGTFAIGGGAYALMPRENCGPSQPGMASDLQPKAECRNGYSSGGGHGWFGGSSSRSNFFGGDSSSSGSHSGASTDSASGGVTRGGFGSFAHAFGFGGG